MPDTTNKPVIFLAFANDRDDTVGYLRNLPDEARRLRDVLQPAEQAGLCEVVVRSNSTAGDIFKVFQDPKYRNRIAIFHYGGHANGYQLLLESAAGEAVAADAGGLAAFVAQQQGLQLVFLNGCSTQQQTQGLLDANISAVISTSRAIEDQVATDFAHQFYQGLAGGATIRTAYGEAEAAVHTAKGGNTRALYFGDADDSQRRPDEDRWPWNLHLREGSESADQWNLPDAVNDPLFGLPPLPEQDLPETLYRHLNWFTRKDAEVFFGRGHQVRELYDRLTAPRSAPIMLFYGQSGVGKSSILDAGVIPRLEQDFEVRYLRRTAGGLLDTLQLAFLPEASDVPLESAWRVKEEQTGRPLIVFLDQVEELYTRPLAESPDELVRLLQVVQATFVQSDQRPRGKLVLGFRKEWLAELETQLVAFELPRAKVFLEPLDRRGIVEVVQGPARSERLREQYGLTIEDGLAEIIADDLLEDRDSAIAPTLQILLTKMWTKATDENYERPHFSLELYHQLKRDGILLRDFLNQQIAAFRERYPEAVDSGLLLDIVALHTTPLGTADQRTVEQLQQQYAHLGAALPDLLQQCQDLYLLTVAVGTQKKVTKTTRLAHDTLAPLVREQFDVSDKPGQRARRILDNRSVDWEDDREGTPLDEADLMLVEQGVRGTRALDATEQRLLESSRRLRTKLHRTRMILRVVGGLAVVVIAGLGAFGWWSYNSSEAQKDKAQAARKEVLRSAYKAHLGGGVAERDRNGDPTKAIHHFLKADALAREKHADPELREPRDLVVSHNARIAAQYLLRGGQLVQMLDLELPGIEKVTAELPTTNVGLDAEGKHLIAWTTTSKSRKAPGHLQIWGLETGERKIANAMERRPCFDLAGLNHNGTRFFGIQLDRLSVFEIQPSGDPPKPLFPPVDGVLKAQFRSGSSDLLFHTATEVKIYRDNSAELIYRVPNGTIADCSFARDEGSVILCGSVEVPKDVPPDVAAAETPSPTPRRSFFAQIQIKDKEGPMRVFDRDYPGATISRDRATVALVDPSNRDSFDVFDIQSGDIRRVTRQPGVHKSSDDEKYRVTIVPDAATVSDAATGSLLTRPLTHAGGLSSAVFSKNGRFLATGGKMGTIRVWRLGTDALPKNATVRGIPNDQGISAAEVQKVIPSLDESSVSGVAYSRDKKRLVTAGSDGNARVWDVATKEFVSQNMKHERYGRPLSVKGAAFISDDSQVLTWTGWVVLRDDESTVTSPGYVRIWDAESGLALSPNLEHPEPIAYAYFDPANREITSLSDGAAYSWSVPDPTRLPADPARYAEVVTGTRLNAFGELEFLSRQEWIERAKEVPDYLTYAALSAEVAGGKERAREGDVQQLRRE